MILILSLTENPQIVEDLKEFFRNLKFNNFNDNIKIFVGYKPEDIQNNELFQFYNTNSRKMLEGGCLGCGFSHIKMWEYIANSCEIKDGEFTLIFEEDAIVI